MTRNPEEGWEFFRIGILGDDLADQPGLFAGLPEGCRCVRIDAGRIGQDPSLGSVDVLVVGDSALDGETLDRLLTALDGRVVAVIPCPSPNCRAHPEIWEARFGTRRVAPHELAAELTRRAYTKLRARFVPQDILDPAICAAIPPTTLALWEGIRKLPRFLAQEWARAVGVDRRTLAAECRRHFRATPREILGRYKLAVATRLIESGATYEEAAQVVAMSSGETLHRAFRIRGVEPPRRLQRNRSGDSPPNCWTENTKCPGHGPTCPAPIIAASLPGGAA